MCVFCGGQCGGAGEFLIAIGLPFLVLCFLRIKNSLGRLKNRIFRKGQEIPAEPIRCECCDQLRQDCRAILTQSIDPQDLELLELKSHKNRSTEVSLKTTRSNNHLNIVKEKLSGVKGWLLLLCLNFTIFIPASYLYQVNCVLDLFNSTRNRILLLMFKALLAYNVLTIATMLFLAVLSFYAGLRLWNVKPRAVKISKAFLIIQLFLTFIITIIRPFMTFSIEPEGTMSGAILLSLIPSLLQFCFWYLYLSKSRRVYNTYKGTEEKRLRIMQAPTKLEGYSPSLIADRLQKCCKRLQ